MMKEQQLSRQMMLISVEALLLDEQGLIACGRGSDVARFGKTD
jgi:phosphopantothenate synthetase